MSESENNQNDMPRPSVTVLSSTGSNKNIKLKPLEEGYVKQTQEKLQESQEPATSDQNVKIKEELSGLKGVVTENLKKIEANLARTLVKNVTKEVALKLSQKVADAKKEVINKGVTSFVEVVDEKQSDINKGVTSFVDNMIREVVQSQSSSVSPTENPVNLNNNSGEINNDTVNPNSINLNMETNLENTGQPEKELSIDEISIDENPEFQLGNEQPTEAEKNTLSDFFKSIGEKLNSVVSGIGSKFTELSNKMTNTKNVTFSNVMIGAGNAVTETKKDVANTNITDDIKNKITGALDTFYKSFQSSIPKTHSKTSNRDKVFGKMLKDFSKAAEDFNSLLSPKQQKEKIENTLQQTTPASQNQTNTNTNTEVSVDQVNSSNSSDSKNNAGIEAAKAVEEVKPNLDLGALAAKVNSMQDNSNPDTEDLAGKQQQGQTTPPSQNQTKTNTNTNTEVTVDPSLSNTGLGQQQTQNKSIGNSLETIQEETDEDLQKQETDVSGDDIATDISVKPLYKPLPNQFTTDLNRMEQETLEKNKKYEGQEIQNGIASKQSQPQFQQTPNLGALNPDKVDNLNLAPFSNNQNIQQQYPPSNRELDEIKEKLNNIEKKLNSPHAQQQPAPEEKKSEMSNGMKAGLVACFLLLFLINPALVLAIGAVAAVGAGSFYGGKAIMGKINDSLENRKNEKANNQGLVQQQELSKTPNQTQSQNLSQTPTPPSTPKVNTGQNRERGG